MGHSCCLVSHAFCFILNERKTSLKYGFCVLWVLFVPMNMLEILAVFLNDHIKYTFQISIWKYLYSYFHQYENTDKFKKISPSSETFWNLNLFLVISYMYRMHFDFTLFYSPSTYKSLNHLVIFLFCDSLSSERPAEGLWAHQWVHIWG